MGCQFEKPNFMKIGADDAEKAGKDDADFDKSAERNLFFILLNRLSACL